MGSVILSIALTAGLLVNGSGSSPSYFGFPLGEYLKKSEVLAVDAQGTAEPNRYICFTNSSGDSAILFLDWQPEAIRFHRFKFIVGDQGGYECNDVQGDRYVEEFRYKGMVFARLESEDFYLVNESSNTRTYRSVLEKEEGCFNFDDELEGEYSVLGGRVRYLSVSVHWKDGLLSEISESVKYEMDAEKVYSKLECQ